MAAPHILAKTLKDAHAFAREELGLSRGQYRVVTSPSSISSVRGADLYLVPGYEKRHDRFSMIGALRYTRLNKINVAEAPHSIPDDLSPAGEQMMIPISSEDASAFFELPADVDASLDEPAPQFVSAEDQTEESERRTRRRRCKECGILVDPDKVEDHASEHLPTGI